MGAGFVCADRPGSVARGSAAVPPILPVPRRFGVFRVPLELDALGGFVLSTDGTCQVLVHLLIAELLKGCGPLINSSHKALEGRAGRGCVPDHAARVRVGLKWLSWSVLGDSGASQELRCVPTCGVDPGAEWGLCCPLLAAGAGSASPLGAAGPLGQAGEG